MDVTLLVNPAARAGAHTGAAMGAAELLRAHGIRTTIISGGSAAESTDLLRTAIGLGTDAVVVAGGDGTVHLAIQELAGTGIPLGIIPAGTGNDFAATLGLKEMDVAAAADAIAAAAPARSTWRGSPAADGSSTYFGSVLASGFDSKVNDRANAHALAARRLALQHRDPHRVPDASPASPTRSTSSSRTAPASASSATS